MLYASEGLYNGFQILKSMLMEEGKVRLAWIIDRKGTIITSKQIRKNRTSPSYLNCEPIIKYRRISGFKHMPKEELELREKLYSKIHGMNRRSRGFKGGDETCPS